MIVRRQLYSQNKLPIKKLHDNGMEFKPIYKKVPQPNTVNKPLNAASASTTIMQDVEDLLKPIQMNHRDESIAQQNQASKERTERNLWRNDEVLEMLYTMQQVKALEKLNDKTVKSENVFKDVEVIMHRNGFVKKSHLQIWTKWKFLKSTYMTSRRNGVVPRIVPPQVYKTIHQMISGLNQSMADSCSSVDGDNSSVSGMVISGVEGGVSDASVVNANEEEDSFGMAHPIFGFRLGTVKAEPEDTGYEGVETNGSDRDPLEEQAAKSDKEVKEEHNNVEAKTNKEPEYEQQVLEVPHRGRGRPPKNPPTATSTPIHTPSPASKPSQMPPLRVAPFAKDINTENPMAANRPPPPLTMPPSARIRIASLSNLKNEDPTKFAQPKLIPKPTHQQHSPVPVQPVRISKEITTQSRSSSTPSPSYPKMKQIPMRKTPYSLRPDRAIPDLEASLSPPPPAVEKPITKKLELGSTNRHFIMQKNPNNMSNNANRKRHIEWKEPPVPNKQAKYHSNINEEINNFKSDNTDNGKNYGQILQNVIIDLSSSLRKMQTEMMRDFFNKQNELLEREHKFQMQQDEMIMKAFQEQTQEIMCSVKQLVGSIKTYKNDKQNEREKNVKSNRKNRMQEVHEQDQEEEMDEEEMEINNGHVEENEVEDDEQEQGQEGEHEIEQDAEDVYTDGEEQQDQLEENDENYQEEMENNSEVEEHEENDQNEDNEQHEDQNQAQISGEQTENELTAEENDNSNDSANPLHMK